MANLPAQSISSPIRVHATYPSPFRLLVFQRQIESDPAAAFALTRPRIHIESSGIYVGAPASGARSIGMLLIPFPSTSCHSDKSKSAWCQCRSDHALRISIRPWRRSITST